MKFDIFGLNVLGVKPFHPILLCLLPIHSPANLHPQPRSLFINPLYASLSVVSILSYFITKQTNCTSFIVYNETVLRLTVQTSGGSELVLGCRYREPRGYLDIGASYIALSLGM